MKVLVVTNPFGGFKNGDTVTDAKKIEEILNGEHAAHVVQADHPDEAPPVKATVAPVSTPKAGKASN